jgi:hypothetical protein
MLKLIPHPRFGKGPVPLGALKEWNLKEHPDALRIALRPVRAGSWDYVAELWQSRAVLARAVRMQERGERPPRPIRPVVSLGISEGH